MVQGQNTQNYIFADADVTYRFRVKASISFFRQSLIIFVLQNTPLNELPLIDANVFHFPMCYRIEIEKLFLNTLYKTQVLLQT